MENKIEIEKAVRILLDQPIKLQTETIPLTMSYGRVLAEDIYATEMVPGFDRSPFDGYAFRGEDTADATRENPAVLSIIEEIPAGELPAKEITQGYAAKILTGAPIPVGANAVVKFESTEFNANEVKLFAPVAPHTNIITAGEDAYIGDELALSGTVITPPAVGLMASIGKPEVIVYKRPIAGIISNGSELIHASAPAAYGKTRESNYFVLSGYLNEIGFDVRNEGIVIDDPKLIAEKIEEAWQCSDVIITTGGASVGDYDWIVRVAERIGANVLFWQVNMKPGGSMMAAVLNNKMLIGLSGNPSAAIMGLIMVSMPYLKKLCGRTDVRLPEFKLRLREPFGKDSPQRRLLRGRLLIEDGEAYFTQHTNQGNFVLSSMINCDLLADIPAGSSAIPAGAKVRVYRCNELNKSNC